MKEAVCVLALAIAFRFGIDFAFQQRFAVHDTGAVVVTGASSGIGEHAASALVAKGFTVFAGVRKQKDADRLANAYPGIRPLILDVSDADQIAAAAATVAASGIKLVALVNNAGVQADMPVELQTSASVCFSSMSWLDVPSVIKTVRSRANT